MKLTYILFYFFCCLIITSCSITKYVPNGRYLLDNVDLKLDTKEVSTVELNPFIQQKPNDPKFRLKIYSLVNGGDSVKGIREWITKNVGETPILFSENQVIRSVRELTVEMKNKGYLNASVTSIIDTINKKAKVTYLIKNNEAYKIRNYSINTHNNRIDSLLEIRKKRGYNILRSGDRFDMYRLEKERESLSRMMRNQGYYASTEDNLHYDADTTLGSRQVDLSLRFKNEGLARFYKIEKVKVLSGYDPLNTEAFKIVDSIRYKSIDLMYDSSKFLRSSVINANIRIRPGSLFSEKVGEQTYTYLNDLGSLGRVNIQYEAGNYPDSSLLDCKIFLTPGNIHSIQTGLDGTNKAGDLGIAANINYGHHNLFNGSESFNIRLHGAYEFVSGSSVEVLNHNFYELGIVPTLTFPTAHIPFIGKQIRDRFNAKTQYGIGFDFQKRPEYTRNFFNLNWKILWKNEKRTMNQALSLIDINYVIMPWKSEKFEDYLNNDVDSLTKYSYNDIFTAGINYNLIFTNAESGKFKQKLYTVRFNAESSGNALGLAFKLADAKKSDQGQYTIIGNPFAQYMKGDIDFSQTIQLNSKNGLAFHSSFGLAYPYGNSAILPFEKRYYSGGPNSIRGWNTRHLGPGAFHLDNTGDPAFHVGDIKLEANIEYRYKWIKWMELATFIDAGNIWTIKDYAGQPEGQFKTNSFYKEIAIGTGFGIRFDLSFLILRLDLGTRAYDPALPEGERWMFLTKKFRNNSALYVSLGYPF